MKTIKIIDLFVKIANGEKVPKKIKYKGDIYKYFESHGEEEITIDYRTIKEKNSIHGFLSTCVDFESLTILNEEVEIIEDIPKDPIFTLRGTPNSIRKDLDLPISEEEIFIQIPLEEYKHLLTIKGRYEELVKKEIISPNYKKVYVSSRTRM